MADLVLSLFAKTKSCIYDKYICFFCLFVFGFRVQDYFTHFDGTQSGKWANQSTRDLSGIKTPHHPQADLSLPHVWSKQDSTLEC